MTEKESNNNGFILVAIVSVVAVVGIFVMITGTAKQTQNNLNDGTFEIVLDQETQEAINLGGQAHKYAGTWIEYCMGICEPRGVKGASFYRGKVLSCMCTSSRDRLPGT